MQENKSLEIDDEFGGEALEMKKISLLR